MNKLILGNCLEKLKSIDDKSIDLIITDPPYAVGVSSSGKKADYGDLSLIKPFMNELAKELFRVIKDNGAIYMNCDWRTYPIWFDVFMPYRPLTNLIVWDYGWIKAGGHFRFRHELIMFWAMDKHKLTNRSSADVWRIKPVNFTVKRHHPAEKPVPLIEEVFRNSEGKVVLDPFMGSGSTGVACNLNDKDFIGIELNPKYFDVAKERLNL